MQTAPHVDQPAQRRVGWLGSLTDDTLQGMARRKVVLAYLFLFPTILGILVFTAGPVVVGARCAPTTPNCGSGLVYYFRGGRPPTAPHAAFFSTSDAPGSNFGAAVALRSPWWPTPPARRAK